jgi:hypothetical protein
MYVVSSTAEQTIHLRVFENARHCRMDTLPQDRAVGKRQEPSSVGSVQASQLEHKHAVSLIPRSARRSALIGLEQPLGRSDRREQFWRTYVTIIKPHVRAENELRWSPRLHPVLWRGASPWPRHMEPRSSAVCGINHVGYFLFLVPPH